MCYQYRVSTFLSVHLLIACRGMPGTPAPTFDYDALSLGYPKGIFLTVMAFCFNIIYKLSYPTRFTAPFFEEIMKWAYLKYLDLCLPKAKA
jgi:hypothetical protein